MAKQPDLEGTKNLMAALGRLPPKQHKDMKIGKAKVARAKSPGSRARKPQPRSKEK